MPRRLPESSVRASRPACRIHQVSSVWASRVAGVRKRREVSPGVSEMRANSRQRAILFAARVEDCAAAEGAAFLIQKTLLSPADRGFNGAVRLVGGHENVVRVGQAKAREVDEQVVLVR